jgi:hypothetical protein
MSLIAVPFSSAVAIIFFLRVRHEPHLGEAARLRRRHHLRHDFVAGVLVGAQLQLGLRSLLRRFGQALLEHRLADHVVVPVNLASAVDGHRHRRGSRLRRGGLRLRQVQLDRAGEGGRAQDEDHQQHQHHVHQGVTLMSDIASFCRWWLNAPNAMRTP